MNARLRPYAWAGIVVSLLIGSYSLMGVMMAGSMNAAYAKAFAHGFSMWAIFAAASAVFLTLCVVGILRGGRH